MISSGRYSYHLQDIAELEALPKPLHPVKQMLLDEMKKEVAEYEEAHPERKLMKNAKKIFQLLVDEAGVHEGLKEQFLEFCTNTHPSSTQFVVGGLFGERAKFLKTGSICCTPPKGEMKTKYNELCYKMKILSD